MHPQIQQDHPGVCPICNMELILKGSSETMEGMESLSDVKGNRRCCFIAISTGFGKCANRKSKDKGIFKRKGF